MVPSSRIVSCISAFMSDPLSEQELVLGLHHLLPAHLQAGVVDDFPAVLHAQLVERGDVLSAADRLVVAQGGDRGPAAVAQLATQCAVHGECASWGETLQNYCPSSRLDLCRRG